MVQNTSGSFYERRTLLKERAPRVHVKTVTIVHGWMSPQEEQEATFIVFEFNFLSLNSSRRIKYANISVKFGDCVEVSKIAPDGRRIFTPTQTVGSLAESSQQQRSIPSMPAFSVSLEGQWERLTTTSSATIVGKRADVSNRAEWVLSEDGPAEIGIPRSFRTAFLLQRHSSASFDVEFAIELELWGFTSKRLDISANRGITIDPSEASFGVPDSCVSNNLGDLLLEPFIACEWPLAPSYPDTDVPWGFVATSRDKPTPSESWYVELWALDSVDGQKWTPRPSSRTQLTTSKFPKVKSESIPKLLTKRHLDLYLSPAREPSISKPLATTDSQMKSLSCVLIARRLEQHDLTGDEKLMNLLEFPETRDVLNFFELDKNMAVSRQHDRGTCEIIDDKEASRQVYVIQTPLDTGGFWSLMLETVSNKESMAPNAIGLIQVDSDVNLESIFGGVHSLAQTYGPHPILVPLQLFVQHCSSTAQTFKAILRGVNEIDRMFFSELESTKSSVSREANALHRKMNLKIHQHSVMLADLRQRRTFEDDLAAKLLPALDFNPGLQQQAGRWATMAESNDLDIESLPAKIESQRAVLFNLIAQLDTSLSTRLASESLRDSKAMKTLSVLTILFLPGAFVATVFSTNMFPFRDQKQEIWIYFAIVIPLTALLMLGWLLWLFMKPGGIDEEKGQTKNEKRD